MKASDGAYYQGIDHIRAVAAILVYCWHALHFYVPPQYHPSWMLLSWFEEGHTGVALFMTLSGYLFAKLAAGQQIDTLNFLWNRACRLLPLFIVMYVFYALTAHYTFGDFIRGLLTPTEWPGASWSLAIELQFYLVFPAVHWLRMRRGDLVANATLLGIVVACMAIRTLVWIKTGSVEYLAYWSIVGRADQLVMGMLFYELSRTSLLCKHRGALLAATVVVVLMIFHRINLAGGCFDAFPQVSASSHWVWLPLFEGVGYGCLIMCYDTMSLRFTGPLSDALARVGELSYSIYMIHSGLIVGVLWHIVPHGTPLPVAVAASAVFFLIVVGVAQLSYTFIEAPFLRFRRPYLGAIQPVRGLARRPWERLAMAKLSAYPADSTRGGS